MNGGVLNQRASVAWTARSPLVAPIETVISRERALVTIGNSADVAPAATLMDVGTATAASPLDNATLRPGVGAGNDRTTRPVAPLPLNTAAGLTINETSAAGTGGRGGGGSPTTTLEGAVGAVSSITGSRELQPLAAMAMALATMRRLIGCLAATLARAAAAERSRFVGCLKRQGLVLRIGDSGGVRYFELWRPHALIWTQRIEERGNAARHLNGGSRAGQHLASLGVYFARGGQMNLVVSHPPTIPRWVSAISEALSLLGFAGLVLSLVLGFETPNTMLLATSGAFTCVAPMAVLWHVAVTRTLTTAEKRMWMREFTGAEALSAISEYMTSPDLRASVERRAEDAAIEARRKNQT
jgi:hypothetical protein